MRQVTKDCELVSFRPITMCTVLERMAPLEPWGLRGQARGTRSSEPMFRAA
jgi:hypothetical protein